MENKISLSVKAENWKFDFNLLSKEDKDFCLKHYHGDSYQELADDDKFGEHAMAFIELNALIANGLLFSATLDCF